MRSAFEDHDVYIASLGDIERQMRWRLSGVQFNYTGRLTQMSDGTFAVVAQQRVLDDEGDGYGHAV